MELQNFLRHNGSIIDLENKYAIKANRHKQYNNLVLFKYNQIESPFAEQIVRESRGVILDEDNNWEIVSRPFDKFFNYGEGHQAQIDWSSARVFEKLDGSLSVLYVYNNQWFVSSSGSPDASGQVNDYGFSFEQLFREAYKNSIGNLMPALECGICFVFELTSKYNKVVVRYDQPSITLIGARHIKSNQELTVEEAVKYFPIHPPIVKSFSLNSFEDIINTFPTMSPLSQEGYVVCDKNFNRVKVKSPAYISLHHLKNSVGNSKKNLVLVALNGEIDEVVSAFPEFKDFLEEADNKINSLVFDLEKQFNELKDIKIQKEFALQAVLSKCPGALFSYRAKKINSMSEYIRRMQPDHLMNLLGYK